jgi:hypothetical protein
MGEISKLGRRLLTHRFEAACGDVADDGSTPFFIFRKDGGKDVVHGTVSVAGATMTGTYTRDDVALDSEDVARLFAIVYLEVFTMHHHRKDVATITLRDDQSGAMRTLRYADDAWLEPEWRPDA